MKGHLNLVPSEYHDIEKRVLPRFPFSYLTFRNDKKECDKVFEVHDISLSGMRVILKDGEHTFAEKDKIGGTVHWRGKEVQFLGHVEWVEKLAVGISFNDGDKKIKDFLSVSNIVDEMVPVHQSDIEIPLNLKYWVRADGPVEIFVWQHSDGEISKFLIMIFDHILEWEDGKGLRTGKVISRQNIDSPLNIEDEFTIELDSDLSSSDISFAIDIVSLIPEKYLSLSAIEFVKMKLGAGNSSASVGE